MDALAALLPSCAISAAVAALVRYLAPRLGLVDRPRPDRWHRRAVPRLGGVAIYLAFTVPLLVRPRAPGAPSLVPLVAGGAAIFVVGLLDDLVRLEARPKLVLLVVCAALPVALGLRFTMLPPIPGAALAMVWILGATNAFNWFDNMDGVASGIAAIAAGTTALVSLLAGAGELAGTALLLAGAAAGFLLHNFPPARVFMGDAGSGFLGFTLAAIAVMGSSREASNVLLSVLVPGLILAVPIFDTALVTVQRLAHRRSVFQGGRDHPAHRLVAMGLPERRAVLMLYGLSALAGAAALLAARLDPVAGLLTSLVFALGLVAVGVVLSEIRVYEEEPAGDGVTPLPRALANARWIAVIVLDLVLVSCAYVGAHYLRYDGRLPPSVVASVEATLPAVAAAKLVGLYLAGVYRGSWRYASALDYVRVATGGSVGSLLGIAALFLWTRLEGFSRGALVMDWLLALVLVAGSRLSLTVLREYLASQAEAGRRVLIFGAGRGGALLLRDLREDGRGYRPVGFVDDDPTKAGTVVQGLRVLGTRADLPRLVRDLAVEAVILAVPSGSPGLVAEVRAICAAAGAELRRFEVSLQ
jgi:UDP-GlcNAc:undecaprenyl-phosphate GlcNAc-1-phosphate transferase